MEQLKQNYLEAHWAYVEAMSSGHQQAFQERLNKLGKIKYRYDYLDGLDVLSVKPNHLTRSLKRSIINVC